MAIGKMFWMLNSILFSVSFYFNFITHVAILSMKNHLCFVSWKMFNMHIVFLNKKILCQMANKTHKMGFIYQRERGLFFSKVSAMSLGKFFNKKKLCVESDSLEYKK